MVNTENNWSLRMHKGLNSACHHSLFNIWDTAYLASSLSCDPKQLKRFSALTLIEPNLNNTESRLLQLIVWPSSKCWNKIIKFISRINRKLKSTSQLYSQAYQNLLIYIWPMKNSAINLALLWYLFWEKHFCWET